MTLATYLIHSSALFAAPLILISISERGLEAYSALLLASVLWFLILVCFNSELHQLFGKKIASLLEKTGIRRTIATLSMLGFGSALLFLSQVVQEEIVFGCISVLVLFPITLRANQAERLRVSLALSFLSHSLLAYATFVVTTGQLLVEPVLPALSFGFLVLVHRIAGTLARWSDTLPSAERLARVRKQRRKAKQMSEDHSFQLFSRVYSVLLPLPVLCIGAGVVSGLLPTHFLAVSLTLYLIKDQVYAVRNIEQSEKLPLNFLSRTELYLSSFLVSLVVVGLIVRFA